MTYTTIAGLEGREPVGAVLRIGRKDPQRGHPIERDRFYFCSPLMNDAGVRPILPEFADFHYKKGENGKRALRAAEACATVKGNLVHATEAEAFRYYLRAQVLGSTWKPHPGKHPTGRPVCEGDGERATRFHGTGDDGAETWEEMKCPNDKCEFRIAKVCKPFGRLWFRPRWSEGVALPNYLTRFATHSWNTVANLKGFFEYVRTQAEGMGLAEYSLYGVPFVLHLAEKKQAKENGRRFPVVTIAPDGDLVAFFAWQRRQIEAAGGHIPQLVGATSPEEGPEVEAADVIEISPGVPGEQGGLFR